LTPSTLRTSRASHLAAAALAAASLLSVSSQALAFCRTWSCVDDKKTGFTCPKDPGNSQCPGGIPGQHNALYWPVGCIGFSLNQQASKQLNADRSKALVSFTKIANQAFSTWQKVRCRDAQGHDIGNPSIAFYDLGDVECRRQEYNQGDPDRTPDRALPQGNANIVLFREDIDENGKPMGWPYDGDANALAVTTLTYNVQTGEIYDADIEINGTSKVKFTTGDANVQIDLLSVLTHEAGHFIGIAHSPDKDATMFALYESGSTSFRDLSPDDEAAICAIYPPTRVGLPQCDPTPRHGYSSQCAVDAPAPSCTTSSAGSRPGGNVGSGALLVALASASLLAARRRAARS
jgi:hypothetical protein